MRLLINSTIERSLDFPKIQLMGKSKFTEVAFINDVPVPNPSIILG